MIFNASESKESRSRSSYTYNRQNWLSFNSCNNKEHYYYVMIKGVNSSQDVTTVYMYVPNIGVLKYIKQILTDLKGKKDNTIIEVNTPLSTIDKLTPKENQ